MICSKCGNELRDGDKFCGMCGTPVEKIDSTNTVVQNVKEGNEPNTSLVENMRNKFKNLDKKTRYKYLFYACAAVLFIISFASNSEETSSDSQNGSSYSESDMSESSQSSNNTGHQEVIEFTSDTSVRLALSKFTFTSENGATIRFPDGGYQLEYRGRIMSTGVNIYIRNSSQAIVSYDGPYGSGQFALVAFEWGGMGLTEVSTGNVFLTNR